MLSAWTLSQPLVLYLQSECLKEAFSDLDMTSEVLQILMSPDKPYLRLSTFGNAGSIHVSHEGCPPPHPHCFYG